MKTPKIVSLNGQVVSLYYQKSLRLKVLYHLPRNLIFNNLTNQNIQQIHRKDSSKKSTRRSKQIRWYIGFHCQGNIQEVLDIIAQKIQESRLNNVIPLIHIVKKNNRNSQDFYLFLAIEIKRPGEFPNELSSLPYFSRPIVENTYLTCAEVTLMLGQVQKIQVVERRLNRSTQKIDPFENSEILEQDDDSSNPNLLKLLDWFSTKGYGSWVTFQNVCKILKIEKPSRVLRNLKLLGHLETSGNGKKWSIAPTALVPLNHEPQNLEFYLCGQQNDSLRQQLKQIAEVKPEGQPAVFGLPRWRVTFSDRSAYEKLDTLAGVPIHKLGNIAQNLAECLPTLEEWQATLTVIGGIVPSQRSWQKYQPDEQEFKDCGLPAETGFYEMRREANQSYPDRTLFYEADTQTWRSGDWYGLRFLALHHSKKLQKCCYYVDSKQLVISSNERWPQLYERALVLASGYLPQVSGDRLFYHNITPDLAHTLTQKLSLAY